MKIAMITGASSGLGKEFAKGADSLYKNIDEIWLVARREHRLCALSGELHIKCRIFAGDLTDDDFIKSIKDKLKEKKPEVRLIVNAAGFGKIGQAEELDQEQQLGMIDLNCRALTGMTLAVLPYMGRGGRMIQVASAAAFCPQPDFAVYAATKSYVLSFSRALNEELAHRKITVTAVCPGPVDTEFFDRAGHGSGIKNMVMAEASQVVKKAMKDAVKRKPVSVYGAAMKAAYAASSVIPDGAILQVMKRLW